MIITLDRWQRYLRIMEKSPLLSVSRHIIVETRALEQHIYTYDRHLRTRRKCRKLSPAARVLYISRAFSNARSVLSKYNTRLRLLCLVFGVDFIVLRQLDKTRLLDQFSLLLPPYLLYKSHPQNFRKNVGNNSSVLWHV